MIELKIDETDQTVLREVLESARTDLGYEIANTDRKDYRDMLRQKRDAIARLLEQLG